MNITTFDNATQQQIARMLQDQHIRLAQLDRPSSERTLTARNYGSAIKALGDYLARIDAPLPTKSALECWRDDLLAGRATDDKKDYAARTVNARLAAARKLLRAVAADVTDIQVKLVLNDWATVADAKLTLQQDMTERDYGRRFSLESVQTLLTGIDTSHLKGMRDRAIIALMVGAGLRVSEVVALTLRDVFLTQNESGQRGIHVRRGKHNRSRVIVLNGWGSWVLRAVQSYTDALDLDPLTTPDEIIVRGVRRMKGGGYDSRGAKLSTRKAQDAVSGYQAEYEGEMVTINAHDLRRTYAKLCQQSGMTWEALRANMGHSSVVVTERYVGHAVDWSARIPNWSVRLE